MQKAKALHGRQRKRVLNKYNRIIHQKAGFEIRLKITESTENGTAPIWGKTCNI